MKTISRYTATGLMMAAILALGAVTGMAQDPTSAGTVSSEPTACKDPDLTPASEKVTKDFTDYGKLSNDDKQKAIDNADAFAKKYAGCESAKALVDYVNQYLPGMKTALKKAIEDEEERKLVARFDNALKAKQFDEVYASGKEILQKYPDKYRSAEIVLGTIGYDEAYKGNNKYNEDTLKFARQSIADLEANKEFKLNNKTALGLKPYEYNSKEDAIGWLNLYIGYILSGPQKNRAAGLPHLYKASQATTSAASKNPVLYEMVGDYYLDMYNKLIEEEAKLLAEAEALGEAATEAQVTEKKDAIEAKRALMRGTADRLMDAYSRAYTFADPKAVDFKKKMKGLVEGAYQQRFKKPATGIETWIASSVGKPFPNPTTPVAPVTDAAAVTPTTTTSTTAPAATSPATTTTKVPPTTPVKSTTTTTAPGSTAKPAMGGKPQAKKTVAKRKRA